MGSFFYVRYLVAGLVSTGVMRHCLFECVFMFLCICMQLFVNVQLMCIKEKYERCMM